ncbi:MAG: crotonase/enoyl-CoA hydratase family protein [Ilumatobacteraceae bacterium]|jgi:enoyl-CoA hydratase/carnithine racemase|nr:crotonase/enoyl-CoA hydratase family protein [Ilumatobacteraceae bacterium]
MPEYTQIRYEVSDSIATVTLARPEKMNAFTGVMMRELLDVFDVIDADDAVRAVIVTGDGKAFCAGADLSSGAKTFDDGDWSSTSDDSVRRDGGGQVTLRIFACKKPVIAAINGAAVGIGATMTLPMDVRLASSAARIGFVFTRRGIVPEACSSWFLPRVVGISRAAEWVYTGRILSADEAASGGLVRTVYAPDELLPAARALAREIADNTSGVSVALSRQMLWRMLGADHPMQAHRVDSRAIQLRGRSADAHEGVTSFLEKRPAQFSDSVAASLPDVFPEWQDPQFS